MPLKNLKMTDPGYESFPAIWNGMSDEAKAAYAHRTDQLWTIIRAFIPNARGEPEEHIKKIIAIAKTMPEEKQ